MHLLNVHTYKLTEFLSDIPNYAILSHTWHEEDILFQDIGRLHEARAKKGWFKVEKCCQQARNDGWGWVWIDTCCIDKSSSAELSEAINSMFSWYSRSMVCYAFLNDIDSRENFKAVMNSLHSNDLYPEGPCRWLLRGWTLQELIAPLSVIFFNREWEYIGSKRDLLPELVASTFIDQRILESTMLLSEVCAAEKLSWVYFRKTTREEDMAYCLLGIFDVNMSLLYGEGTKAFTRLQEEILRTTEDHSLFLSHAVYIYGEDRNASPHGLLGKTPLVFNRQPGPYGCFKKISARERHNSHIMTDKWPLRIDLPIAPLDRSLAAMPELSATGTLDLYLVALNVSMDTPQLIRDDSPDIEDLSSPPSPQNDAPQLRVALIVYPADGEEAFPGMPRKFEGSGFFTLVDALEVATWVKQTCLFGSIDFSPKLSSHNFFKINWFILNFGYEDTMGYRVTHESTQIPFDTHYWTLECPGRPSIFIHGIIGRLEEAKTGIWRYRFCCHMHLMASGTIPPDFAISQQALRNHIWFGQNGIEWRNISDQDGPVYEHRYNIDGDIEAVFTLVNNQRRFHVMVRVQKILVPR